MSAWIPSTSLPEAVSSMFSVTDTNWHPYFLKAALIATWSSMFLASRSIL